MNDAQAIQACLTIALILLVSMRVEVVRNARKAERQRKKRQEEA